MENKVENKVESQEVINFFSNTMLADADSRLKTLAYEEVKEFLCITLYELCDIMTDWPDSASGAVSSDGVLHKMYQSMLVRFNKSALNIGDTKWKCNKDLTDKDIEQFIIHIILGIQLDKELDYVEPRQFTNMLTLLLSQFYKHDDEFSKYVFNVIIMMDDLELYQLYFKMFDVEDQHLMMREHYIRSNHVMDKHGWDKIYLWLTPQYVEFLHETLTTIKGVVTSMMTTIDQCGW